MNANRSQTSHPFPPAASDSLLRIGGMSPCPPPPRQPPSSPVVDDDDDDDDDGDDDGANDLIAVGWRSERMIPEEDATAVDRRRSAEFEETETEEERDVEQRAAPSADDGADPGRADRSSHPPTSSSLSSSSSSSSSSGRLGETVGENGGGFWREEERHAVEGATGSDAGAVGCVLASAVRDAATGKAECARGADDDDDDDDSAAAGPVEAVLGDRRRDGGGGAGSSATGESKREKTEMEPSSSRRGRKASPRTMPRERETTAGEDSRVDDDPRVEVYESSSGEDSDVDDDPKIEVYESDGDEEGSATASRMPLLPTTVASDDGFDGCDRTRRERWRRRVRRAIAAAI